MGKDKLRKFKENETFSCLIQPKTDELIERLASAGNPEVTTEDSS